MRPKLDPSKTWITEPIIEWTDGFLLGDGHLSSCSPYTACAQISSSNPNWTTYSLLGFEPYKPTHPKMHLVGTGANKEKKYEAWQSWTLSHPDLRRQWERWYGKGRKTIPQDVRLTGTSLRLWFIGDGSLDNGFVRIAANDFTREELEPVVARLRTQGLDFHFGVAKGHGTEIRLYLVAKSTPAFFDLIGRDCPVKGYEYKFEASPDRWLRTVESTAQELGVNIFWLRYLIRDGRVEVIKREKLRFITPEDFKRIKEIRDREYLPRKAGTEGCEGLTQEDVMQRLRVHFRRLPGLIAQAGITPRRTEGGHYRFTEEDVGKMTPFVNTRFHDLKIKLR